MESNVYVVRNDGETLFLKSILLLFIYSIVQQFKPRFASSCTLSIFDLTTWLIIESMTRSSVT